MNRKTWDDLVAKNPMLIEIHRFRRRFLTFSGSNAMNTAVLALTLVCYAGLVLVVMSGKGEIPPIAIVICQTVLFTFFAPGMLHGAIAGERERRSWDLLLVAPVTKSQIIAGKFIGALTALGLAAGLFLVPMLLSAVTWRYTKWHDLFVSETLSLSFSVTVCAFTLLISARVRRPFMALGATLGSLAMVLVVLPLMLLSMIGSAGGQAGLDVIFFLHPIYALMELFEVDMPNMYGGDVLLERLSRAHYWGWPQTFVYLGLAAILITWAAKTLNFAENDVRFMPRGNRDA